MLCFGTEKILVFTWHRGYLAIILSNPLMWSNWTEGSTFTLRTKRATSSIFTPPSPMRLKVSLLLTIHILMSTPFNTKRSWKHKSSWGLPIMTTCLLTKVHTCRLWRLCSTDDRPCVWQCFCTIRPQSSKILWLQVNNCVESPSMLDTDMYSWMGWLHIHSDSHPLDWTENEATSWWVLHRHHPSSWFHR